MVERSLVVLAGIVLHWVADCERTRDWLVLTMAVHRCYSDFEKIGCLLVVKKVAIRIEHAFRVHSRGPILVQLRVPGNLRYHFCSESRQVERDLLVTHTCWRIQTQSDSRLLEKCSPRFLYA